MNKRWIIIIVAVVIALVAIGYMQEKGMLNFKWQTLTILFAALAVPFKFIANWLRGKGSIEDIQDKHAAVRAEEKEYREAIEAKIKEREQRINLMNKELELLDTKLELVKAKREKVDEEVSKMTVDEKINKFQENFGQ